MKELNIKIRVATPEEFKDIKDEKPDWKRFSRIYIIKNTDSGLELYFAPSTDISGLIKGFKDKENQL